MLPEMTMCGFLLYFLPYDIQDIISLVSGVKPCSLQWRHRICILDTKEAHVFVLMLLIKYIFYPSTIILFWLYSCLVIGLLCKFTTIGLKSQSFYFHLFIFFLLCLL